MNNKRNILFSWILLIGFFIPIGTSFVHNFEKHEHAVCNAKNVKHFHKYEQDCSILHYITHSFVYSVTSFSIPFYTSITTNVFWNSFSYFHVTLLFKSSRAPPVL